MPKKIVAFFIPISILIIAISFAYYLLVLVPKNEASRQELERLKLEQSLQIQKTREEIRQEIQQDEKQAAREGVAKEIAKLNLLDKCLNAAKSENSRVTEELLKWAEQENKDGKYDLTGAFDDLKRQLGQALEECYAKYPQN